MMAKPKYKRICLHFLRGMTSERPTLLWISHFLPWPPHGGSAQRNYNLMREISREFDLYNVGFMQRPHQPRLKDQRDATQEIGRMCAHLRTYRIPSDYGAFAWKWLLATNLFSSEPYSAWRFRSREFETHLRTLLERKRFDIVYADTVATAPYALRAKGRAKLVLNHHNVESALLGRRAEKAPTRAHHWYLTHQAAKLREWERRLCAQFDLNQAVSTADAQELRTQAPDARYEIVPNGTDTRYFVPTDAVAGHEMVFAGGGTWMPNRDAMSWFTREIFPIIGSRVPDAVMHVIGTNPPPMAVAAARRDPRIRIHGFVPDVRPYLARAAVYVAPIRVGGGTRLKILDAFAAGKAVVSTTVGCEGIDCVDGVHIRLADTPDTFADVVVRLFDDSERRRALEREARSLAEQRYAWPIIGSHIRGLYRELVR